MLYVLMPLSEFDCVEMWRMKNVRMTANEGLQSYNGTTRAEC